MPVPSPAIAGVLAVPVPGAGGADPFTLTRLGVLTSQITPQLVAEVIEVTGCRERRRRLLPAEVAIYLILGWCLLSGGQAGRPPGYRPAMESLSTGLRHVAGATVPTRQALARARSRIGDKPLELLFDRSRGPRAAPGTPGAFAFGRRVTAIDATTMDAPLTPANLAAFGTVTSGSVPAIRILALIETGTHALIDAAYGGAGHASEHDLARQVLHALSPGVVCLADRNFPGYELWTLAAAGGGADLIWRIKDNRVLTPVTILPDGSYLAVLPTPHEARSGTRNRRRGQPVPATGTPVRVISYAITARTARGTLTTRHFRLITTLLDPAEAPAAQIAALYHQRWESEGGYQELKTRLIGAGYALRSGSPDLVRQELWAILTVYHALCALETEAAATAGLDPRRISWAITLRAARDQVADSLNLPAMLPQELTWFTADILASPAEPRRDRQNERKTSPPKRKYQTRSPAEPRPPSSVAYTLTVDTRATTTDPARPPAQTS
jgi:hypothetical protein